MKENNAEVGVIVARFQSPFLHEGHLEILNAVISKHPRVIVFLGLSPLKCTFNNPYDFSIRKAMLEEKFPNVETFYIEDVGDNGVWSQNLDRMIAKSVGPSHKVVLYGSRDSFIRAYSGRYPTVELVPTKYISASEIRREAGIKAKNTLDFRLGIAHAVQNQFPSFKLAVDMAVINFETDELLFARKPGRKLLCFPGGFTDPSKDMCIEDAAIRETQEETGLVTEIYRYVGSTKVDDARYKAEQDKIMSALFIMKYIEGTPKAADDIEFVTWKKFGQFGDTEVSDNHRPLLHMLNANLGNVILRWP
jgi:bifunctional NMN adenylyltransferase/nudix hydrolase